MTPAIARADRVATVAIVVGLLVIYNANGREIGSYDSQPTKFAARELLLRGSLSLNHVVGRAPLLTERPAFVAARDGRYRSAYSPMPAVAAAAIVWPLWQAGILDIRAPLAPQTIAVLAASMLTALAVALAFLTAREWVSQRRAIALAAGLGLGTGYWPIVSQTLWQHETAIFGLTLATFCLVRRAASVPSALLMGGALALAVCSRLQVSVCAGALLMGWWVRAGWRHGAITAVVTGTAALTLLVMNTRWFGTPLGAAPMLEALHPTVHHLTGSWAIGDGFAGLLISPSRGLLVFSPIAGITVLGLSAALHDPWKGPLRWCVIAAALQYLLYASYSVWWGGHTYGPRYLLDLLPVLVPVAAAGMRRIDTPAKHGVAAAALAWSVLMAATGAVCYPHERWNSTPLDVDRHHERLWDWRDPQWLRCWGSGLSPQNFSLFSRDAFRNTD